MLDNRATEDGVDASLDLDWAGVRSSMKFVDIGSCLTGSPGSLISIRSSSSSLAGVRPPSFMVSASSGADHLPSGSTTTESTVGDVDPRISSTYLNDRSQMTSGYKTQGLDASNLLVYLQRLETRGLGAHWTSPCGSLLLQL